MTISEEIYEANHNHYVYTRSTFYISSFRYTQSSNQAQNGVTRGNWLKEMALYLPGFFLVIYKYITNQVIFHRKTARPKMLLIIKVLAAFPQHPERSPNAFSRCLISTNNKSSMPHPTEFFVLEKSRKFHIRNGDPSFLISNIGPQYCLQTRPYRGLLKEKLHSRAKLI